MDNVANGGDGGVALGGTAIIATNDFDAAGQIAAADGSITDGHLVVGRGGVAFGGSLDDL